jgi:DNA-directed RNA polymerase specialized sigma24 family protein
MNEQMTMITELARKVADRIATKCWSVPREDLRQEAVAVALVAQDNFDPAKGELRGYLHNAIARHLINYVYDAGTIVSYKHRRALLKEIRSAELKEVAAMATAPEDAPVEQVMLARWRVQVVARVTELAGQDAAAVVPCLLDDATPMVAAKASGLPLSRVLVAVGRVREAMSEDATLSQLWKEMP